jgi:hypothetical protein
MKSRVLSVVSQGWFVVVAGFLLFNVAAANAQAPTIASVAPSSRPAGGPAFSLTVTGTNLNSSSVVRWNGNARVTTLITPGTLEAAITALDIAVPGTAEITVLNPGPAGGQTSNAFTFTISGQTLTVTSVTPSSAVAGGPAFTLTVNGTNFTSTSVVQWNGSNRTTTFVDSTRLTAAIPAADIAQPGTATVRVVTGTANSNSVNFTAASAQAPTITTLLPSSRPAGGAAFSLTVTGTNLDRSSVVRWNGNDRVTTVFTLGTTLEAAITALDIAAPGTAEITVFNPGPGGGQTSNSFTFTITGQTPTVTSITPSSAVAGGPAFTLTVTGTNFTSTSIVQWNGTNRTTTFVDATRLTAAIPAPDIAQPGMAAVRVLTGTANSNSVNFTVTQFSSLYFPQVVAGGGYNTVFAINNLGASTATGTLILTDNLGSPFVVSLNETPVSLQPSEEPVNIDGSSFGISVPAGGARVFLATSLTPLQLRSGWARFESTSAGVVGLSTFLLSEGLTLRSVAGVFATQPVEFATIGVDNSLSQGRFTGFSIANPTNESINIRIVVLNAEGSPTDTIISPPELNPLGPQRQVSKFLHEYLPARATFRGSMVLLAQSGRRFVATALIQFQGLLTATPVTPDKPAAVTN